METDSLLLMNGVNNQEDPSPTLANKIIRPTRVGSIMTFKEEK
jgi:hypothetical protein